MPHRACGALHEVREAARAGEKYQANVHLSRSAALQATAVRQYLCMNSASVRSVYASAAACQYSGAGSASVASSSDGLSGLSDASRRAVSSLSCRILCDRSRSASVARVALVATMGRRSATHVSVEIMRICTRSYACPKVLSRISTYRTKCSAGCNLVFRCSPFCIFF